MCTSVLLWCATKSSSLYIWRTILIFSNVLNVSVVETKNVVVGTYVAHLNSCKKCQMKDETVRNKYFSGRKLVVVILITYYNKKSTNRVQNWQKWVSKNFNFFVVFHISIQRLIAAFYYNLVSLGKLNFNHITVSNL